METTIDNALRIIIEKSPSFATDASWALLAKREIKEKEFKLIWMKVLAKGVENYSKDDMMIFSQLANPLK
jgi:hypothetical protein